MDFAEMGKGVGIVVATLLATVGGHKGLQRWRNSNSSSKNSCPDLGCRATVQQNAKDIGEIKGDLKDMKKELYPKVNQTAEDVSFIRGEIKGILLRGG